MAPEGIYFDKLITLYVIYAESYYSKKTLFALSV